MSVLRRLSWDLKSSLPLKDRQYSPFYRNPCVIEPNVHKKYWNDTINPSYVVLVVWWLCDLEEVVNGRSDGRAAIRPLSWGLGVDHPSLHTGYLHKPARSGSDYSLSPSCASNHLNTLLLLYTESPVYHNETPSVSPLVNYSLKETNQNLHPYFLTNI